VNGKVRLSLSKEEGTSFLQKIKKLKRGQVKKNYLLFFFLVAFFFVAFFFFFGILTNHLF